MQPDTSDKDLASSPKTTGSSHYRKLLQAATIITPLALLGAMVRGCPENPEQAAASPDEALADGLPKSAPLEQRFFLVVKRLDKDLVLLRNEIVWNDHEYVDSNPDAQRRLQRSLVRLEALLNETQDAQYFAPLALENEALRKGIPEISALRDKVILNQPISSAELRRMTTFRGLLKGILRQEDEFLSKIRQCRSAGEDAKTSADTAKERESRQIYKPLLANVNNEPSLGEVYLNRPISDVLMGLWRLSSEERRKLTTTMVETPDTKVLRMEERDEPGLDQPVMYVWVEKSLHLPTGDTSITLKLRQTIEERDTTWTAIGTKDSGGVVIRNCLVDEVPIDEGLSLSAYNTCLTYFAGKGNDAQKTRVTYSNDQEVTFYQHCGRGVSDSIYRSGACAISRVKLGEAVNDTLAKAKLLFENLVDTGTVASVSYQEQRPQLAP